MKERIGQFFISLENTPITIKSGFWGLFTIIFVKMFLENFINGTILSFASSDLVHLLGYFIWFFGVYFSLVLVLSWIGKREVVFVSKVILFFYIWTWVIQIFNLLIYHRVYPIPVSVNAGGLELLKYFISFGSTTDAVSYGQQLGVAGMALSVVFYFWSTGINKIKSIISGVLVGLIISVWGALPSIIKIIRNFFVLDFSFNEPSFSVVNYFYEKSLNSYFVNNHFFNALVYSSRQTVIMAQASLSNPILFALLVALVGYWAYKVSPKKLRALVGNLRTLCIMHFYSMIAIGLALATTGPSYKIDWIAVINIFVLFAVYYFVWMYAVGVNDVFDYKIDCICNAQRPLVKDLLTKEEMEDFSFIFLILAIMGGLALGPITLFLVIAGLCLSYLYSTPPLRLKRVPVLSLFIMAASSLTAVMSGFYLINYSKTIFSFPYRYTIATLIFFTLWGHIKDLKDAEGDKQDGVMTLANIAGEKNGRYIVGFSALVGFLIVPLILGENLLFISAIPAAILSYYFCLKSVYKANALFSIYFGFLALSALIIHYF
jgi:4-hydroxybenzoate polyprenyltransferase